MDSNCLECSIHATYPPPPTSTDIPISAAITSSQLSSPRIHSSRSQWLRAAVLGANDGLISISSLMIGVGAVNQSSRAMLITGFAGLLAGSFSMSIGEFVSVYTQYDIESAQSKRDINANKQILPNPWKAAFASAVSFTAGAVPPLLAGGFIKSWMGRVAVVGIVSSIGLASLGAASAIMGGAAAGKAAGRVLVGGWIAMLVTYGVLRLFGLAFDMNISPSA